MWMKGGPRSAIATKLENRKCAVYNGDNPVKFATVSASQRWCSLVVLHQYPSAFLESVHCSEGESGDVLSGPRQTIAFGEGAT